MASLTVRKDSKKTSYKVSYSYYNQAGKRRTSSKSFSIKKEALEFLKAAKEKEAKKKKNVSCNDPLQVVFNEYLNEYGKMVWNANTYQKNVGKFQNYILPSLGSKPLKDIDNNVINEYYEELKCMDAIPRNNSDYSSGKVTESIVFETFKALRKFFNYATKRKWIEENPMEFVLCGKEIPKYKEKKFWDENDIKRAFSNKKDRQLSLMIALGIFGCTRVGELTGLRYDTIKWRIGKSGYTEIPITQEVIRLNKEVMKENKKENKILYVYPNEKGRTTTLTICKPKTKNSERIIHIPDEIASLLLEEVKYIQSIKHNFSQEDQDQCLLFVHYHNGRPIEKERVNERLNQFCVQNRLPKITSHCLRHTGIQFHYTYCDDIKTLTSITGHTTDHVLANIYIHKNEDSVKELLKAVQNSFHGEELKKDDEITEFDYLFDQLAEKLNHLRKSNEITFGNENKMNMNHGKPYELDQAIKHIESLKKIVQEQFKKKTLPETLPENS